MAKNDWLQTLAGLILKIIDSMTNSVGPLEPPKKAAKVCLQTNECYCDIPSKPQR